MDGILDIDVVGHSGFVDSSRDGRAELARHAPDRRSQSLKHVAPMRHHIECKPAPVTTAVIPARALTRLLLAVKNPGPGLDADRNDAPEEAGALEPHHGGETRKEQLVLDDAMPDAGPLGEPRKLQGLGEIWSGRLLDMDVLPGSDRLPYQLRPATGSRAIHENLVRSRQGRCDIARPAQASLRCRQRFEPVAVAADDERIGDETISVAERQTAFPSDIE
jgi:hypothetical protein